MTLCVLYLKGKLPDVDRIPTVAHSGGQKSGRGFVRAAKRSGISWPPAAVVVSGCALGIDAASLMGALRRCWNAGKSVLPRRLTAIMWSETRLCAVLSWSVAAACLTEQATEQNIHQEPSRCATESFPVSAGAPLSFKQPGAAGTLITAHHAQEQNQDVFVLSRKTRG